METVTLRERKMKKSKLEKQRHQVKSRWYYIFWGTCTVAVCAGQVLVGSGFRRMAESNDAISADINLLVEVLTMPSPKTMPVSPSTGGYGGMPIIE